MERPSNAGKLWTGFRDCPTTLNLSVWTCLSEPVCQWLMFILFFPTTVGLDYRCLPKRLTISDKISVNSTPVQSQHRRVRVCSNTARDSRECIMTDRQIGKSWMWSDTALEGQGRPSECGEKRDEVLIGMWWAATSADSTAAGSTNMNEPSPFSRKVRYI